MGIGTGLGSRGRRGRPARRRHRPHHRRRQRRNHGHHHHRTNVHAHHRTGVHHGTGVGHNGIHHQIRLIFLANRRRPATRTRTGQHRTSTGRATASSTGGDAASPSGACRLPAGCIPAVVTVILLTLIIVPFAVPEVPFPIGIAFTLFFIVIVVVPQVANIVQTYKARRGNTEPDVEAPPDGDGGRSLTEIFNGPLDGDEDLGLPQFFDEGTNGSRQSSEFSYDPPPSFSETTAQQVPNPSPGETQANPELPNYHVPENGFPYPPAGLSRDHEGLPPPPSYDEVIKSVATPHESADAEES